MVFWHETAKPYVVGNIGGQVITANFGNNDRILFLLMGAALAEIQSFEFLIGSMLALVAVQRGPSGVSGSDLERLSVDNFEKCMGPLIKAVRSHSVNDGDAEALQIALNNRNLFIHRFLRDHKWPMDTDDNYLAAITHLQEIRRSIWDADRVVHHILAEKRLRDVVVFEYGPESGIKEI
jgi:hypothetical protein